MAMLTWRWRWEWSGNQRPDLGLRWSSWVSSRPLEPLCQGNMAPWHPVGPARQGDHGPWAAGLPGRRPGQVEAGVPVVEQRGGHDRLLQVEEGEDEQLIPEDVAPVGL